MFVHVFWHWNTDIDTFSWSLIMFLSAQVQFLSLKNSSFQNKLNYIRNTDFSALVLKFPILIPYYSNLCRYWTIEMKVRSKMWCIGRMNASIDLMVEPIRHSLPDSGSNAVYIALYRHFLISSHYVIAEKWYNFDNESIIWLQNATQCVDKPNKPIVILCLT